MNIYKVAFGLGLFLTSSMILELLGLAGWQLTFMGQDYAPAWTAKILDTLAGSLIIWGIIDYKPRGKKRK